jgi:hypothetical protein
MSKNTKAGTSRLFFSQMAVTMAPPSAFSGPSAMPCVSLGTRGDLTVSGAVRPWESTLHLYKKMLNYVTSSVPLCDKFSAHTLKSITACARRRLFVQSPLL